MVGVNQESATASMTLLLRFVNPTRFEPEHTIIYLATASHRVTGVIGHVGKSSETAFTFGMSVALSTFGDITLAWIFHAKKKSKTLILRYNSVSYTGIEQVFAYDKLYSDCL
jgi:hypothetical protein